MQKFTARVKVFRTETPDQPEVLEKDTMARVPFPTFNAPPHSPVAVAWHIVSAPTPADLAQKVYDLMCLVEPDDDITEVLPPERI